MRSTSDPAAVAMAACIRSGDVAGLEAALAADPSLATDVFGTAREARSALHIATDWPGHFANVAQSIQALVASGADVNARMIGPNRETPLHWAASSDDVDALIALLDAGADIDSDGGVLDGGSALSDAVIFEQWRCARVLVERGATMTLWHAAALGEIAALEQSLADGPSVDAITNACWHASRAGQMAAVQRLVSLGADLDWVGHPDHGR
jgi:uncharacterized protein